MFKLKMESYIFPEYADCQKTLVGASIARPCRFAGVDEYTTKESNRLTRLPLYYGLTEADRAAVVQVVKDFFAQK